MDVLDCSTLFLSSLIKNILYELTHKETGFQSVIKINSANLNNAGDLSFMIALNAWRGYVDIEACSNFKNILEYCLKKRGLLKAEYTNDVIVNEVNQLLILLSEKWSLKISFCRVLNQRFFIHLDRSNVIAKIIKIAIHQNEHFGCNQSSKISKFNLVVDKSKTLSHLTQERLSLLKNVTANILSTQGHELCHQESYCVNNYLFTTRSQGKELDNYFRYICGVVKTNKSDRLTLTCEEYSQMILKRVKEISENKLLSSQCHNVDEKWLENMVKAIFTLEMLSAKPSGVVTVKCSDQDNDIFKNAIFVLYNTARIASICKKYEDNVRESIYPKLLDIDETDFSLLNQENEWELVFNFILKYPEMLHSAVKLEPNFEVNPHHICSFLYCWSQAFSAYYRQTRILVKGFSHLVPTMVARIYLLKVLGIVVDNCLKLLNIKSVAYM